MTRVFTAALTAALAFTGLATAQVPDVDIPYESFQLENGLTVVVHEDRKAPIVAVSIWYGVGSANEPAGRTGFAHLFEHLMFNGSENYNDDYFGPFEQVGATGMNGTTWFDRTNYFQTVPTPALEMALWMESDRMTHLLGAVDQERLDEQRGVVQNEKRQGDNQPYGMVEYSQLAALFPEGHPYAHSTIGSMEDLSAASLEDVQEWFRQYYGASNAVLVLAGDIDAEEARPLVERYFGDAPVGPPLSRMEQWIPEREYDTTEVMYDDVPQPRIYRTWVVPGRITQERAELEVFATVLGGGRTSRLYRDFVFDRQVATRAVAYVEEHQLASQFHIEVTLNPGEDVAAASARIDEILGELLEDGPTQDELDAARTRMNAGTIRGLEQIGGFGGKAVALAEGQLYAGDPGFWRTNLERMNNATADEMTATANEWLTSGSHQINVLPFGEYASVETDADRSALPVVDTTPDLVWPDVQTAELSNGVDIVFVRRDAVPVVEMQMVFDAGYAADSAEGGMLGLNSFMMNMLDEGAGRMDALEISAEAESLGANLSTGANLDLSTVTLSALASNLQPSLNLMATVITDPTFADEDIERVREQTLNGIRQEMANPIAIALRTLPPEMYGEGHAYSVPFTGSGTPESVAGFTREALVAHQQTWLRPDNATLFIVGDTTLEEITPMLERAFRRWDAPSTPLPVKNMGEASNSGQPRVIIVDRPNSPQSLILAGLIGPEGNVDNPEVYSAMNDAIGGSFTARVNMNLREDKGWSYGAQTLLWGARGQRPWIVYAPVQTDRTADSLSELLREFTEFTSTNPATEAELERSVNNSTRSLPGQFETASAVRGSLVSSYNYGRDWNYPATLTERYRALELGPIHEAAEEVVNTDNLVWLIVGDAAQIEDSIRELDMGEIEVRRLGQ
ncbi:M16 family metallopeptidase [Maricaulis parjimensis]|uniref:M16 family metallopeptidase n=1 Tax=Maricaulis parjimensis TaxID=144023 RepID=UPI00193A7FAE|nr:pitrilysin family protein [Maricaulis parjimensis]